MVRVDTAQAHKKADTELQTETHRFKYKGKTYRIYKPIRSQGWMIRMNYRCKQYKKRLSPFKDTAISNAKYWIESILNDQWDKVETMKLRSEVATINDIVTTYKSAWKVLEVDVTTARDNATSLMRIVEIGMNIDKEQLGTQRATVLTGKLISDYQANAINAGLNLTTVNARIVKARSVFSRRAMPLYSDLKLPDLSGFMTQARPRRRTADQSWRPLCPHTIERMEEAAMKLKQSNPAMYRCYLLAARLGMRNSEILAARGDWLERRNGHLVIAIVDRPEQGFATKAGVPRWLPLSDELILEFGSDIENMTAFLVAPNLNKTNRENLLYRDINNWIRDFIPDRNKGLYELRKWAGSRVATETGNIYKAKEFLGHTTVLTTERHYAKLLDAQHKLSSPLLSSTH